MKNKIILLAFLIISTSCEDVIDVNLNTTEPKLVIEASINWFKGTSGNEQQIKLTLTAPYFDATVPSASGAQITITDTNNTVYNFVEDAITGIYKNNTFIPVINETYNLLVIYNGENFTATETLKSVVPIDYVLQNDEVGFTGEDTELKAFYTDPVDQENYYLFEFTSNIAINPTIELEVYNDEFTNGNEIFGYFSEEDLETGDQVIIRNYGISERFYEFMFILLQQNSEDGGGPFETQPATIRGNCINQTNPKNFPLGYFRLSEVDELMYTIQ